MLPHYNQALGEVMTREEGRYARKVDFRKSSQGLLGRNHRADSVRDVDLNNFLPSHAARILYGHGDLEVVTRSNGRARETQISTTQVIVSIRKMRIKGH